MSNKLELQEVMPASVVRENALKQLWNDHADPSWPKPWIVYQHEDRRVDGSYGFKIDYATFLEIFPTFKLHPAVTMEQSGAQSWRCSEAKAKGLCSDSIKIGMPAQTICFDISKPVASGLSTTISLHFYFELGDKVVGAYIDIERPSIWAIYPVVREKRIGSHKDVEFLLGFDPPEEEGWIIRTGRGTLKMYGSVYMPDNENPAIHFLECLYKAEKARASKALMDYARALQEHFAADPCNDWTKVPSTGYFNEGYRPDTLKQYKVLHTPMAVSFMEVCKKHWEGFCKTEFVNPREKTFCHYEWAKTYLKGEGCLEDEGYVYGAQHVDTRTQRKM